MNILDAIKTGRRVRRPMSSSEYQEPEMLNYELKLEDLLAEDWEVEPETVEISLDVFAKAYQEVYGKTAPVADIIGGDFVFRRLAKRIGFDTEVIGFTGKGQK